jgi:hypothetical protein
MAKKKAPEANAVVGPYEPPTCIRAKKSDAAGIGFGDKVRITLEGTVNRIGRGYGDDGDVEIELKPCKIVSIDGNDADKALRNLNP